MMNWNDPWVFPPRSEMDDTTGDLTKAFRYALMPQDTSNASDVHQWLINIFHKKEIYFC